MNKLIAAIQQAGKDAANNSGKLDHINAGKVHAGKMSTPELKQFVRELYRSYPLLVAAIIASSIGGHDGLIKFDYTNIFKRYALNLKSIVLQHFMVQTMFMPFDDLISFGAGVLIVDQDNKQLFSSTPSDDYSKPAVLRLTMRIADVLRYPSVESIRIINEVGGWVKYHRTDVWDCWAIGEVFIPGAVFGTYEGFQIPQDSETVFRAVYEIPNNAEANSAYRTLFKAACAEAERQWVDRNPDAISIQHTRGMLPFRTTIAPIGYRFGYTTLRIPPPPLDIRLADCVKEIVDVAG